MLSRLSRAAAGLVGAMALVPASAHAFAADGSGAMTVAQTYVINRRTGNYLTFTYTAAGGGISNGEIDVVVPAGWTTPDANGFNAGGSNADCGSLGVTGSRMKVTGVTLSGGATCSIRYGLSGFNAGDTAPAGTGINTFTTKEKSTSGGAL